MEYTGAHKPRRSTSDTDIIAEQIMTARRAKPPLTGRPTGRDFSTSLGCVLATTSVRATRGTVNSPTNEFAIDAFRSLPFPFFIFTMHRRCLRVLRRLFVSRSAEYSRVSIECGIYSVVQKNPDHRSVSVKTGTDISQGSVATW